MTVPREEDPHPGGTVPPLAQRPKGDRHLTARWSLGEHAGWLAFWLGLNGVLAAGVVFFTVGLSLLPCGFKAITGTGCPGCGLTRSVVATLHGHLGEAVRWHAFGPILLLLFAGAWIYALMGAVRTPPPPAPWEHRTTLPIIFTFIGLYFAYWLLRVLTHTTP